VKYFVVQQNESSLCLTCQNNSACLKKLNIKQHYNSRHSEYFGSVADG